MLKTIPVEIILDKELVYGLNAHDSGISHERNLILKQSCGLDNIIYTYIIQRHNITRKSREKFIIIKTIYQINFNVHENTFKM